MSICMCFVLLYVEIPEHMCNEYGMYIYSPSTCTCLTALVKIVTRLEMEMLLFRMVIVRELLIICCNFLVNCRSSLTLTSIHTRIVTRALHITKDPEQIMNRFFNIISHGRPDLFIIWITYQSIDFLHHKQRLDVSVDIKYGIN